MKRKSERINKKPTPMQIVEFIESMQELVHLKSQKSRLISIKVPEGLLTAFRLKCEREGLKYQSQIKTLMYEWLLKNS